jgi:hypothetical protein
MGNQPNLNSIALQGWGKDYDSAHNISQDPFGDNDAFRAYTAMPAAGPISTVKPVEQMIQARVSPLEVCAGVCKQTSTSRPTWSTIGLRCSYPFR